mmetsp:Transcript_7684/g.19598  ORF Transcript_7684/g.19598 Transcript_7684/m.19598 type:complete len:233 (-) Transcript_7684:378-1076(-)
MLVLAVLIFLFFIVVLLCEGGLPSLVPQLRVVRHQRVPRLGAGWAVLKVRKHLGAPDLLIESLIGPGCFLHHLEESVAELVFLPFAHLLIVMQLLDIRPSPQPHHFSCTMHMIFHALCLQLRWRQVVVQRANQLSASHGDAASERDPRRLRMCRPSTAEGPTVGTCPRSLPVPPIESELELVVETCRGELGLGRCLWCMPDPAPQWLGHLTRTHKLKRPPSLSTSSSKRSER